MQQRFLPASFLWPRPAIFLGTSALLALLVLSQTMHAQAPGVIDTVVGKGNICATATNMIGDGCPAKNSMLSGPSDIAFDHAGNLYIADSDNDRIRKISAATGMTTTVAGDGSPHCDTSNGSNCYGGDGGPATSAQLYWPEGVALDSSGNIYIADMGSNRIRKVNVQTGMISTVAGNGGWGYWGDNGPAGNAGFREPSGVALDRSGNLYIADSYNNRIRKVNAITGVITTVAGNGSPQCDSTQGDPNYGANCYGGDNGPATSAELWGPSYVSLDGSGNLYIADSRNNRMRKVNATTGVITTMAGNGSPNCDPTTGSHCYGGDGGPATAAEIWDPTGMAFDSSGNLYIADTNRVRMVKTNGIISTVAGNGSPNCNANANAACYGGDGGPATKAEVDPVSVAISGSGVLYIADQSGGGQNGRIRVVSGGTITTFAGGVFGCVSNQNYPYDGCPANQAQLSHPMYVKLDAYGNLYIADNYNHRVRKVSATTGIITTIAGTGKQGDSGDNGPATKAELNYPQALAFDSGGNLYVADSQNNRIRMVNAAAGVITTVAGGGNGCAAQTDKWGDGCPATSASFFPMGVSFDSHGNLYISDQHNSLIRVVNANTGIIQIAAGGGNGICSGKTDSWGDGCIATNASLWLDTGMAFDSLNDLYVADMGHGAIRKINAKTDIITLAAGTGSGCPRETDNYGDGCPATSAQLNSPDDVTLDSSGDFYIADQIHNLIRKVDIKTGTITAVAGNGSWGYVGGDGGPAIEAVLNGPESMALDAAGNLFIADTYNNVVRRVQGPQPNAAIPSFSPPGGSYPVPQMVAIIDKIANATAYYAINGGSWVRYTGPINVNNSETLTAYAAAHGYSNSYIASASYLIGTPAAKPAFSAKGGTYGAEQLVTLSDTTTGAAIYYTLDGSAPTASSTRYRGAIPVSHSLTINALATAFGSLDSVVSSATYTIVHSPSVLTDPATSITASSAVVNAKAIDFGGAATVWFIYGMNGASLTSSTSQIVLQASNSLQAFHAGLKGLKNNTTYYFRPVAKSPGGISNGEIVSFHTE